MQYVVIVESASGVRVYGSFADSDVATGFAAGKRIGHSDDPHPRVGVHVLLSPFSDVV